MGLFSQAQSLQALHTFRKHVHQEMEKQRASPYWRYRHNIQAMIQIVKDREAHKQGWIERRTQVEIESALGQLNL